jgi:uncharacterized membrane protein
MSRLALTVSFGLIIAMMGFSYYGYQNIAADAMIARHWDLSGQPNGYSPRNHILVGLPILAIAISALFYFLPKIDPRAQNVRQSIGLLYAGWIGSLLILALTHAAIIMQAIKGGDLLPMPNATLYGVSLLLVVVGNFTAKSRSNFFLGVRTPWTLSSEHAWVQANRITGWLFVLTGIASAGATFADNAALGIKVLLAGSLTAALVGVIVSYVAWKNDPERRSET